MNKKIVFALSLIAAVAVVLTLNLSSISQNMIKDHKLETHLGNNKWGGFEQMSPCRKECKSPGRWCGPSWYKRYYCCDSIDDCEAKKKCIFSHCTFYKDCDTKDTDFTCTD